MCSDWSFTKLAQVKEGVRLRRLLRKKGIRGFFEKSFDRAQGGFGVDLLAQSLTQYYTGWFAVTIIGIVTAVSILALRSEQPDVSCRSLHFPSYAQNHGCLALDQVIVQPLGFYPSSSAAISTIPQSKTATTSHCCQLRQIVQNGLAGRSSLENVHQG